MLKIYYFTLLFIVTLLLPNNYVYGDECPFTQQLVTKASATYYTGIDNGNCGYEKLTGPLGPGNTMIAALGTKLYDKGAMCGQCFNIISPYTNNSVVVMGTDSCPDAGYCARDNHFDLSTDAFDVLGERKTGVLENLSYFKVPCQVNGNVKLMMKDGSNDFWTAFLIFNSKIIIKQVSVKITGSDQYSALTKTDYNYWVSPNMKPGSFDVKIESVGGEIIYQTIPKVESRKIYETSSQFTTEGCTENSDDISNTFKIIIPSTLILFLIILNFIF